MSTRKKTASEKTVPPLRERVHEMLLNKGIETSGVCHRNTYSNGAPARIVSSMTNILMALGLDVHDDSLRGTPGRVAKMYCQEIFQGLDYSNFPSCTTIENKMRYDEMIATKCSVYSVCEHHFVPFVGHAWIAYIPKTKILGLSKFNRVTDFFSRRPQVQERLTAQIASTLQLVLATEDVAIVIRATHMCVGLRGIKDHSAETITSKMGGKFFSVPALRSEFLALTR
jgi:GTP cyclohydrolase IA